MSIWVPATNVSTFAIVLKMFGKRSVFRAAVAAEVASGASTWVRRSPGIINQSYTSAAVQIDVENIPGVPRLRRSGLPA